MQAVILLPDFNSEILTDSKKLTDKTRRLLKPLIENSTEACSLGIVTASEIDQNRMAWAVRTSFRRAMAPISNKTDVFLVDGNSVANLESPSRFLIKGDSKSLSIAAASVIAKVTRDDIMLKAHDEYPEYGFDSHKGYGTAAHIAALEKLGPCPIHRMSFAPLSRMYQTGQMSLFPLDNPNSGKAAEIRAARYYENIGFKVLNRNWRSSSGEIDLIVQNDSTVFFVEVKSTLTNDEKLALEKIDNAKLKRIRNAAEEWMTSNDYQGECSIEAVLVTSKNLKRIPVG